MIRFLGQRLGFSVIDLSKLKLKLQHCPLSNAVISNVLAMTCKELGMTKDWPQLFEL